jgi:hypothetical protein
MAETSETRELALGSVAEMRVQRAGGGVDRRWLAIPGDDQSLAAVRQKILGKRVDPSCVDALDAASWQVCGSGSSQACRERCDERGDLPALETEPVIGHRSRQ